MDIRKPQLRDIPRIVGAFADVGGFFDLDKSETDSISRPYIMAFIQNCIETECSFIVEVDREIVGWCFSSIVHPWFSPNIKTLQLHTIFVREQYKNTLIGGKLFLKFETAADAMLKNSRADNISVTKRPTGSNINYQSRGYIVSDTTFTRN